MSGGAGSLRPPSPGLEWRDAAPGTDRSQRCHNAPRSPARRADVRGDAVLPHASGRDALPPRYVFLGCLRPGGPARARRDVPHLSRGSLGPCPRRRPRFAAAPLALPPSRLAPGGSRPRFRPVDLAADRALASRRPRSGVHADPLLQHPDGPHRLAGDPGRDRRDLFRRVDRRPAAIEIGVRLGVGDSSGRRS